jgi:hypothetical protein
MKVLYSPGFGAGWSTWSGYDKKARKFMMFYKPLIQYLEEGHLAKDLTYDGNARPRSKSSSFHPIMKQFVADFQLKFGSDDIPYLGGVGELTVATVSGPFSINEYDGSESIITFTSIDWIFGDTD